ncbi:hypothetical protein MTBPR1_100046 [Candidatus Terasakiella magnetica]|uniref:Uncharacterized protein n=1 Tax=Candidatus Terasakiella magnetica TaxID=1867952 RepID=A0A1C3RDS1_9PROT|nr:hypothetical protein [Candidatus Terasakiella magnetica]SCA55405.1 hypothetical protein MTBPR1_100046 [Candidatus Terasakiella magnetica]
MTELAELPLWQRIELAKAQLEPVQSDYRVVFDADIDQPSSVLVPDPNWMAMALHGGVLPPVSVYHELEHDEEGKITNAHILHETAPLGPMSEEEAIEYLVKKDTPEHVWKAVKNGNSIKLVICKKDQLPASREWRNAWKNNQEKVNDDYLYSN